MAAVAASTNRTHVRPNSFDTVAHFRSHLHCRLGQRLMLRANFRKTAPDHRLGVCQFLVSGRFQVGTFRPHSHVVHLGGGNNIVSRGLSEIGIVIHFALCHGTKNSKVECIKLHERLARLDLPVEITCRCGRQHTGCKQQRCCRKQIFSHVEFLRWIATTIYPGHLDSVN